MRSKNYEKFMKIAICEAENSLKDGKKGFGAVIAKNGELFSAAHRSGITDSDPTAPAEIMAIGQALGEGVDLKQCSVFATHEPCLMCAGAVIWAKVPERVYGVSIADSIKKGRTMIN